MFDIKAIRETPANFDQNWARRGRNPQTPAILELDQERRAILTDMQELQAKRNEESKKIGEIKKTGGDAAEQMAAVSSIKRQIAGLEEREKTLSESINMHLSGLPNMLAEDVPDGADESDNVEITKWGDIKRYVGPDHVDIGETLGMMDFETAAKISGSRFVVLNGQIARLERALAQFMLDTHTQEHGYTEVSPPLLLRDDTMFGTGQLPKFSDDQFRTQRGDWLLPTAEVPLTNLVRESIIDEAVLPYRFTAFTPCFRKEAGAAGKDTRGMLRQHQFYKVEMVSITTPEESAAEHERMLGCAETILKKLELPFRTVVLCTGDTGFGAQKTYDIEVWLPGQETYREISSCSNCGDFQARRMNARFRKKGEKNTQFLHTLNGSGVAVGRALMAVMENYYDPEEGAIIIPDALRSYMGGLKKIIPIQ